MIENKTCARVFKAFCDENRLTILQTLRGGEKCACELLERLQIGQPTLSHHMKILCDAGIVRARRQGKWTHYSLDVQGLERARALFEEMVSGRDFRAGGE